MAVTTSPAPTQSHTQADLAALVGVSQKTVNKALNNLPGVSPQVREKVHQAAAQLGYRINTAAKAMSTGRYNAISLLLSSTSTWSLLPPGLLAGIQSALHKLEQHLVVSTMTDAQLTNETFVPKILRQSLVDGLLINYNANIPPRMVELIDDYSVPSIWINSKQDHDALYPDDYGAGRMGAQRLLALGHRRIAFVDFTSSTTYLPSHYSQIDRQQGCRDALEAAGLTLPRFGDRMQLGQGRIVESLREILGRQDRPTAVMTYGAAEARAAFMAAKLVGLTVPGDLSILCFDENPHEDLGMKFATLVLPETQLGRDSVAMLMNKIDQPRRRLASQALAFSLAPGQSLQLSAVTKDGTGHF